MRLPPPLPSKNGRNQGEQPQQQEPVKKLPPPPPKVNAKELALQQLESAAQKWTTQRQTVIKLLEEMILELNDVHEKSSIARVGGRGSSLAGFGVATAGVVLAVPTGGLSLLAVLPGLAVGVGGVATSTGASVYEWKTTRDHVGVIQGNLEYDTQLANEVIDRARVLSLHDTDCDNRFLFVDKKYVQVDTFVNGVCGGKEAHSKIRNKDGEVSDSTVKAVGLVGVKVLCGFNPIITVPIDLMCISDEVEQIKKKEPADLSPTLRHVADDLSRQLKNALGTDEEYDFM